MAEPDAAIADASSGASDAMVGGASDAMVDAASDASSDASTGAVQAVETICNDGFDNDSSGSSDCDEPACALACALPACPADTVSVAGQALGLPLSITSHDTTISAIEMTVPGTVARVAVAVSITHGYADDLDISIASPSAVERVLSSDNGGSFSGAVFDGAVFRDGATTSITQTSPPFTGEYRPEQSLDAFDGSAAAGTWTLSVHDDQYQDTGDLTTYELVLCVAP